MAPPFCGRLLSALRRGSAEVFDTLAVRGWPRRAADRAADRAVVLDAVRGLLDRSRGQLRQLDVILVDGVLPLADVGVAPADGALPLVDAEVQPPQVATPLGGRAAC